MINGSTTQLWPPSLTGALSTAARLLLTFGLALVVTDAHAGVKFDKSCKKVMKAPQRLIVKKAAQFLDEQFDLIVAETAPEFGDETLVHFDPAFKAALRSEVDELMLGKKEGSLCGQ